MVVMFVTIPPLPDPAMHFASLNPMGFTSFNLPPGEREGQRVTIVSTLKDCFVVSRQRRDGTPRNDSSLNTFVLIYFKDHYGEIVVRRDATSKVNGFLNYFFFQSFRVKKAIS